MTTPPAIVAVDIDGTLLSRSGEVLPGTRAEFARARAAGASVVLASGRPVAGLRRLVRRVQLDPSGLVYAGSNGSVVVDADTGETLARHSVEEDLVREIVSLTGEHGVLTLLCDADDLVTDVPDDPQVAIEARGNDLTVRPVADLTALAPGEVHVDKILMYGPPAQLRPFSEVFVARFGDRVEHAFSAPFYFEATARGVDKGSALRDVAAARGVDVGDSVAFGDNGNDVPMIRAAGVGVAMGNAIEAVMRVADRVTASNDDEGIAAVLADLYGDGEPAPAVEIPDVAPMYHRPVDLTDDTATFGGEDHESGGDTTRGTSL
ncbi:Cof-type HAD-IIB family hydrolase [Mobilicoccus pelagius]|uniref:Putative phosphatase n=1 Tax=Mobilicoccus pelagius NBRC 104925 TaxID=1089455 RepID=H5URK4_9MICO|nr:Cof-type HAD-IIB family hydrolase [Mobilicoccus pelagius]GAB48362.1 putative phosphatase [Mobilicoccus pelagius NBRC 104925]